MKSNEVREKEVNVGWAWKQAVCRNVVGDRPQIETECRNVTNDD
jgi:hypothetical protein